MNTKAPLGFPHTLIKNEGDTITLEGVEMPSFVFLERMEREGFDPRFTSRILMLLEVGGKWELSFTPKQLRRLLGNEKRGGNGFA